MIRVTEVLQAYTNFDMIKPDVLDFASVRGTQAHKAIENILTGKWTPIPENARPYVNSFKIFKKDMILKTEFVEKEFKDEIYGLIGHIDWGGYLQDKPKKFTLIDWKTALQEQPIWKGQLSAYKYLAEEYDPKRIGSLRLDPNGGIAKMAWYENSAEAWEAYLCALTALKYFGGK